MKRSDNSALPLLGIMLLSSALSVPVYAQAISVTSSSDPKVRLLVNANYNLSERDFSESSSFTSFLEQGSLRQSYAGGTGIAFEVGGIFSLTPAIGILGSFEFLSAEHDATFEVDVPHPLLFNQNRSVGDELAGLEYSEQALHIDFVYTLRSGAITVDVFGGPTLFYTETELLDEATTSSSYPFDELQLVSTTKVKLKDNPIGFNVGGAVTYRFTPVVGASFQARYATATATLDRDSGTAIELDVGGFRIGGGIRIAF